MKEMALNQMIQQCETTSQTLKLLAHPRRLQLLCHLSEGKKTVGELEKLCAVSQSQISQFLQRMKSEGLVRSERDGKYMSYVILDPKILKLIQALHRIFCP